MNNNEQVVETSTTKPLMLGREAVGTNLAPHLFPLNEQWATWRTICLRGAGFPAARVLKLATPECARLADQIIQAEEVLTDARNQTANVIRTEMAALKRERQPGDGDKHLPLASLLHQIKMGQVPKPLDAASPITQAIEWLSQATAQRDSLAADFSQTYESAAARISQAVCEEASTSPFREALLWQNRRAWHTAVKPLLEKRPPAANRGWRQRQHQRAHEEMIANYLQRYCVKNDSIGFFGPVGWVNLVAQEEAMTIRPGPGLIAKRGIYFEGWCLDALADSFAKNEALKPWLAARRTPFVHFDERAVYLPGGGTLKLSAREAAILEACDGQQTAKQVAARLLAIPALQLRNEAEIYKSLESLCKRGVMIWKLEVPLEREAERTLRKLIEGIEDERLRQPALEALTELEQAREAVARAERDADRIDEEMEKFEQTFTRLTSQSPTRGDGETYAARTLLYEDCRRDIEVKIGPQLIKELKEPLSLLLTSARWITYEVAKTFRQAFEETYRQLVKKTGQRTINAADFWVKTDSTFSKDTTLADQILPELQKRWEAILLPSPTERRLAYTSEQLRSQVAETFAAPRPGWSHARYHSPDVMIAASGPEAIRRGDYQFIIGEVHLGLNSVNCVCLLSQHPDRQEIYQALESDFPELHIVPAPPRTLSRLTARTGVEHAGNSYRLEIAPDSCGPATAPPLAIGSLVIEDSSKGLILRTRDGRMRFDLIDALGGFLTNETLNQFKILPPYSHTPRISVDRLVICRESWRFRAAEVKFAFEKDPAKRFVGARRWMQEQGMPRFIFVKSAIERKPFYVDFESPILINILARIIRRTGQSKYADSLIGFTEMLPAHGQSWLPDIEGNHYTSELRMVVLDLAR